jgi:hypothetical protein
MRRSPLLSAAAVGIAIIAATLAALPATAAQRMMLLETFTNVSCPYCPANNTAVHQFMLKYGPVFATGPEYHVNWPSTTDPFYLLTSSEVDGMRSYYGVNGVPSNFGDGATVATSSLSALETAAQASLVVDAPFRIDVTQSIAGGQVNVTVTVNSESTVPAGALRLMAAVIETEKHYASAPGTNNEKDFYNSMRRMLPTQNGTSLSIGPNQQQVFNLSTAVNANWNTSYLQTIAWIQDANTKVIYQAGSSIARPAYACFYGAPMSADIVALGDMRSFRSLVINGGTSSDTYNVHIARSLPATWGGSVCAQGICYPPFTTDFTMSVAAGTRDSIMVDITPLVTTGSGSMTLTVTSQGAPTQTWTRTFTALTSGPPVLLVDADQGSNFDTWYKAALDSTKHPYVTWDRTTYGALSAAQLDNYFAVVWDADLAYPPVSPEDRAALATFLDHGGRLFISGQDIGWDLCDATSSDYSAESLAWYQSYLGADYVMDDTNILTISGVAGDPIGDGLSFSITGGTGSSGQDYPSEINPRTGASPVLLYAAGREAGIRYESGNFKVVYLAYGFQAQATLASRVTVMNRVLDWFGIENVGVPGGSELPARLAGVPSAAPNPFNPATRIGFTVAGAGRAAAAVDVYDLRGRLVRALWRGDIASGQQSLTWDGRDGSGEPLPSGVYLARIRIGGDQRSLKLVLAK